MLTYADFCRANDQAMLMFAKKDYSTAFELWTEAIRLCPGKSIHHCNRAAVALKLGQYAIAAEDARQRRLPCHALLAVPCSAPLRPTT